MGNPGGFSEGAVNLYHYVGNGEKPLTHNISPGMPRRTSFLIDPGRSWSIAVKAALPDQPGAAPLSGLGSDLVKNLRLEGFAGLLVARIIPLFHHPFLQPGGQGTPVVDILGIDIGSTSGGCRGSDRGR